MKKFVFIASLLMMLFGFCHLGFAEDVCPAGTQLVVENTTGKYFCVLPENRPMAQQNVLTQEAAQEREQLMQQEMLRKSLIAESIKTSGFSINMGLGYSVIAAFELRIAAGYDFADTLNGLSFGLYTDLGLSFGWPDALNWSAGPVIHINSRIYRIGIGLGLGIFSIWGNLAGGDDDYYEDDYYHDEFGMKRSKAYFMLKPQFVWEWFVSGHALLGFGFDLPISVKDTDKKSEDNLMMWFNMHLYVGYKF